MVTQREFFDRLEELQETRKIFVETGLTNNLTHAYEAYQKITEIKRIMMNTKTHGHKARNIMDEFERPKCPTCGEDMFFRPVGQNNDGIRTQLVCSHPRCDTVLNDGHEVRWWMENLPRKQP